MAELRAVDWLKLTRFHKEIAERGERGFFSKRTDDDAADSWSFLVDFNPPNMADSWKIHADQLVSQPFKGKLLGNSFDTLFVGGPAFCTPKKNEKTGTWDEYWNPIFYRQVAHNNNDGHVELYPDSARWNISPVFVNEVDRLQITLENGIEKFADEVVEQAASLVTSEQVPWDEAIIRVFCRKSPDLKNLFQRAFKRYPSGAPTSWAVFAPLAEFSPLTRHLIKDYERLESQIVADPQRVGGLVCLQDQPREKKKSKIKPNPLIPLNLRQERAVASMLGNDAVTVVSGPPGCGKSQVVLSLLLNAWAEGKSVLFASNNNKAVDVVLDRLLKFESEFPIAIRAGNMKVNKVGETLRRIMNMCSDAEDDISSIKRKLTRTQKKVLELEQKVTGLRKAIDSGLPARISETIKLILLTISEEEVLESEISDKKKSVNSEKPVKGSQKALLEEAEALRKWWEKLDENRNASLIDQSKLDSLHNDLTLLEGRKDKMITDFGIDGPFTPNTLKTNYPLKLSNWHREALDILKNKVLSGNSRDPSEYWSNEFNEWQKPEDVSAEIKNTENPRTTVQNYLNTKKKLISECVKSHQEDLKRRATISEAFEEISKENKDKSSRILDSFSSKTLLLINEWKTIYGDLAVTPKPSILKPFARSRYTKRYKEILVIEGNLFRLFPPSIRAELGEVTFESRRKWNTLLDLVSDWVEITEHYHKNSLRLSEFVADLNDLKTSHPNFSKIDDVLNFEDWEQMINLMESRLELMGRAKVAHIEYQRWFEAAKSMQELYRSFDSLITADPVLEVWSKTYALDLHACLERIAKKFSINEAKMLSQYLNTLSFEELNSFWEGAENAYAEIDKTKQQIKSIPPQGSRMADWWNSGSVVSTYLKSLPEIKEWPNDDSLPYKHITAIEKWLEDWNEFKEFEKEKTNQVNTVRSRRSTGLDNLVDLLERAGELNSDVEDLIKLSKKSKISEFPTHQIQKAVEHIDEINLKNRTEVAESKLSNLSFSLAKHQWLIRLVDDDESKKAVHDLIRIYRQNQNQLPEESYPLFESALKLAPIWITVPASSQSIPVKDGAFDLVVIDEATQCSVTNLIPLLYRGKRLAIIGDENQLRSIPTLFKSEETLLAKKHDVEDVVSILGHYDQDVFTAGVESLPARSADIVSLRDHYRSHPQIIGFSNQQIYQGRLELRRDFLKDFSEEDGVHAIQVNGQSSRGPRNRSWINLAEAQKITELISESQKVAGGNSSVGVVTPFSAQANLISEMLEKNCPGSSITVGNAHVFQGDERDIMYFSPVVASGITDGASNWVGNPPNLVNVAVTRARNSLYLVGDILSLSKRRDVLGELARYSQVVDMLRDPNRKDRSPCELFMFSLMCAEGWNPQVQFQIGDAWVDFLLKAKDGRKIVVETDGKVHDDQKQKDKARDAYLMAKGYIVHRVACKDVFDLPRDTIARVREIMEESF
jgi:very-short-patch-repair endonuclease